jgi:hypothetical protein
MNNDNNILHRRDKKEMDKWIDDAMSKINFDNINVWKSIRDLFKHLWKKISRKFGKKDKKSKIDKTE